MHMRWLNIIGLVLNVIASGLLAFWPPLGRVFTPEGAGTITIISNPTAEGRREGVRQVWLRRLGPWLLGVGFFLQLLAASFG
jgi:hypothetical protein